MPFDFLSYLKIAESPNRKRIILFTTFCVITYGSTLTGLCLTWYKLDSSVRFHWFDDSMGWMFIDKFGHFFTAFIECRILSQMVRWTGIQQRRSLWIGAMIAFVSQSSYEIFDGYSQGYGASATDILANSLGAAAVLIQFYLFNKIKLSSKFSFHPTAFAPLRPAFFGDSILQQFLKDYNGQTFWFTMHSVTMANWKFWPSWLFITIGYGADGMLGGDDNIWTDKYNQTHDYSHITRSNRILLSFDFDWNKLPDKYRLMRFFNYAKFPAPAIEFHFNEGLKFHWIYI